MFILILVILLLFPVNAYGGNLVNQTSVTQFGITWTFSESVPVGQFANGDYYVVGAVTVSSISPAPTGTGESTRNGSVLNLPAEDHAGFDGRMLGNRFIENQVVRPPINMNPGYMLISTISASASEWSTGIPRLVYPSENSVTPVKTCAILTCLAQEVSADAFRPAYCDRSMKMYYADSLKRELLPSLANVSSMESLSKWERVFERPWIDVVYDGFGLPYENGPNYGREYGRSVGIAALLLCNNFSQARKETLLIRFVQVGIDLWGIVRAGHYGWHAHGGHGTGRKLPMVVSGYLLGDGEMMNVHNNYPNCSLGEDQHTMYDRGWTGATAVFTGHFGRDAHPNHSPSGHHHQR